MNSERFEIGKQNLEKIDGEAGERLIRSLADIAPEVGAYIVEFVFGEVYNSPELNLREREMITLASLLTQGDTSNQLRLHVKGSLNVGLSQREIIAIFTQCIPYVGFPRVLNAITIAKEVFDSEEVKP